MKRTVYVIRIVTSAKKSRRQRRRAKRDAQQDALGKS
jgi:hypothetical protein